MNTTSVESLLYLDRYRNEGTRVYSSHAGYSEARDGYRPNSRRAAFRLPVYRLPRESLHVFEAGPPEALRERYVRKDSVVFCVHPQILEDGLSDPWLQRTLALGIPGEPISVSPSSSTRTLYVVRDEPPHLFTEPPHALKVHFPFRISRYGRRMRKEVVEQAVNVSRELEAGAGLLDNGFAFLREVLGIAHGDPDPGTSRGESWGYLVRDMTPYPRLPGPGALVPGFSLYGLDFFQPQRPPLLLEMMGDADPRDFLLDHIFLPILRHWVECYLAFGFILEPHGQNVLLELDDGGRIRRIVHRDLSPGIDMRRRRDVGLGEEGLNTYNRMEDGAFASIAFDRMMGGHFFDRLLEPVLAAFPAVRAEDFQQPCREEFARTFLDHGAYLPTTVHYFSENRDRFGKPHFQDTGSTPVWRP